MLLPDEKENDDFSREFWKFEDETYKFYIWNNLYAMMHYKLKVFQLDKPFFDIVDIFHRRRPIVAWF